MKKLKKPRDGSKAVRLKELLAVRHTADVFVPECKNGPSYGGLLILDAWAMKKSWANPLTFGYEIKVSRSDFVGDEKWNLYLPYCAEFYFVAPVGIIDPKELPAEVGLLVASKNLGRLFCKKKAARRKVEIPENLYRYILMCRTKTTREVNEEQVCDHAWWQKWIETKSLDAALGRRVSKGLRETINNRIDVVHTENVALQQKIENLAGVREFLVRLGLTESYCPEFRIRDKLNERVPPRLLGSVSRLASELSTFRAAVEQLDQSAKDDQDDVRVDD